MKTLAALQTECAHLGIVTPSNGRSSKQPWITALRDHYWKQTHPHLPLPTQIQPMLLSDWKDLGPQKAAEIEQDQHAWILQPKLDGVRVLLHVEKDRIRITGRCFSDVTYRLTEHEENLRHLVTGLESMMGTVLDGELVCPREKVDTGSTITESALQAAVAILATSPESAERIQATNNAWLRLHVFDILKCSGKDVTRVPLYDRLALAIQALSNATNPFIESVSSFVVNKTAVHNRIIEQGCEGTVWKKADQLYEPGRRVKHWIKRKRSIKIEAFVTGFKPGSPDRGNCNLIGAIEFGIQNGNGTTRSIAWVSNLTNAERQAMTRSSEGRVMLNPAYLGRRAIITGQNESAKSQRLRHAKIERWIIS